MIRHFLKNLIITLKVSNNHGFNGHKKFLVISVKKLLLGKKDIENELIHPRPDFRRKRWLDLGGKWLLWLDPMRNLNETISWENKEDALEFNFPSPIQAPSSGLDLEDVPAVVWMGKEFTVDNNLTEKNESILLKFGAVDYITRVWLNGQYLGTHVGGFDSFVFDVSGILKKENQLILQVIDEHGDQPRGKQAQKNESPGGVIYSRVTGAWQPAWIEFIKGPTWIDWFKIETRLTGEVFLELELGGKISKEQKVCISFFDKNMVTREMEFEVREIESCITKKFGIKDHEYWNLEQPFLHSILIQLKSGDEILDEVATRIGFREISTIQDMIYLNNKRTYLQMILDQGWYPEGLLMPRDPIVFLEDLEKVVEMGFNGVRAHQKPPDPRYLFVADALGVLIWEEMADWGMSLNPTNKAIFIQQWESIVKRDINHPSVISWVPFNERPEPGMDPNAARFVMDVVELTKKLDSSRLVIDCSGWTHVKTDILDIHDYIYSIDDPKTYENILAMKEHWMQYLKGNKPFEWKDFRIMLALKNVHENQPIIISEVGGWCLGKHLNAVKSELLPREPWCYHVLDDEKSFITQFRGLVTAIAKNSYLQGYCYTQLRDVEQELNGLLNWNGEPKISLRMIQECNLQALEIWKRMIND